MSLKILESIPIRFEKEEILKIGRMERTAGVPSRLDALIEESRSLIEPKAIYASAKIRELGKDGVFLENGEFLESSLLSSKIGCAKEVAPYVATIGPKLETRVTALSRDRMLDSWILDNLGTYAVGKATDYLQRIVEDETGCRLSRFNPGSTPSWSIEQQQVLFGILSRERVRETIGVELGESCIMTPKKSVSGIMAATVREFHNCQACKRECEYRQFSFEGS